MMMMMMRWMNSKQLIVTFVSLSFRLSARITIVVVVVLIEDAAASWV